METDSENKNGWKEFIEDGHGYLKTAVNGYRKRKNIFTPEILYNIVSMSIEKYIMGYLLYHNRLPDNHTLADLIDAVRELGEVDSALYDKIIHMNRFQEICSIITYIRRVPGEEDVEGFLSAGAGVRDFVNGRLALPLEYAV